MAGDAPGSGRESAAGSGGTGFPSRLALYRRYRPATFAEVKGQEHVTEPLRQALRNGRVHHAYLFSGPRGCGKTSSARILARSLNCVEGPTPDPCGVCESCVALAPSGPGSIDVIEIDAASHGGVDDARDLRERAFYAPVSGRFKVYIIDEAHMVTREGFNALLKLVEEPPPHLKFVFATTEPEKVIPTIRSRTHHYPFRLVPPAVLRELLEEILTAEGVTHQPSVLPLVVRAGAGSVRDALSVLDQLIAGAGEEGLTYDRTVALLGYSDDSLLDAMVDAFASGDGAAVFGTVERVVQGGHDPRRFAADLLDRLRDLIILAAVPSAGKTGLLDAPADRLERMADQAGSFGQAELTRAAEILSEGLIQMRGTTSPRLLLELMCAQVLLPGASGEEKVLLARLERLERKLEGLPAGHSGGAAVPAGRTAVPRNDGGSGIPGGEGTGAGDAQAGSSRPRSAAAQAHPGAPGAEAGQAPPGTGAGQAPAATGAGQAPSGTGAGQTPPAARARTGSEQPRQEPATTAGARRPVASGGSTAPRVSGPVTAQTLRERWENVLDAVRDKRKVAWMLLRSASVTALEDGVLTIAFPREGEVKGFSGSGCDQVLKGVLSDLLGLNVRVRAIVNPAAGGPGTGPATLSRPGPAGGRSPGTGNDAAPGPGGQHSEPGDPPVQGRPAGGSGRPAGGSAGTGGPGGENGGQGGAAAAARRAARGAQAGARGRTPTAGTPAAGTASETAGTVPGTAGTATGMGTAGTAGAPAVAAGGPSAAARGPAARPPAVSRSAGFPDEEWPDDAGGAAEAEGLTGMELVQRQLGGQIIEEIDD
jgi:DNA polymerase III subunit gamma/tau